MRPAKFIRSVWGSRNNVRDDEDLYPTGGGNGPVRPTCRETAAIALSTTDDTATRLKKLKARRVRILTESALLQDEIRSLGQLDAPLATGPIRFVSIGRLLHWKGFHLGLEAFAHSGLEDAEYWVIGDGPDRRRLGALCARLGVTYRVRFLGALPRETVLSMLAQCHALVHPSLHDSGGWVCLEAMAAGRPVICLDLGGPAVQVTPECGIKVPVANPEETIRALANAMKRLADDPAAAKAMGEAGQRRVAAEFDWVRKGALFDTLYREMTASGPRRAHMPR
jgi:glycosyltransferase involved in cell wall biosynthesis